MEPLVKSGNQSGFTLIEFCVAVLIMMIGLLGLLQGVITATGHNLTNILRNEAVAVADERMVNAKSTVVDTASFNALSNITTQVGTQIRSGTKSYAVMRNVSTSSTNSKRVMVTVSWQYKGKAYQHSISSFVVDPHI